jgi:DNA polymerase-3 subunit beta
MKITIPSQSLASALAKHKSVIATRLTLPILGNILLEADGDSLTLTSNNLDQSLSLTLECGVAEPGAVTLPFNKLHAMISRMTGDAMIIIDSKHVANITGNRTHRLAGLAAGEYPGAADVSGCQPAFSMPGSILVKWLKALSPAQSVDETRLVLNGIYFASRNKRLELIATESHILILKEAEIECGELSAIIPTPCVSALIPLLSSDDAITAWASDSCASFRGENWSLVSRLIEGTYPNFRQVIPDPGET